MSQDNLDSPEFSLTEEMRCQAIGLEGAPDTLLVEKGAIQRFADAVEDPNPLYTDEVPARCSRFGGIIAPPTFLRCLHPERPSLPFPTSFHRLLDGGSQWDYFEPVRMGDAITATGQITDLSQRKGRLGIMLFVTYTITYTNQLGQVVATQKSTMIHY